MLRTSPRAILAGSTPSCLPATCAAASNFDRHLPRLKLSLSCWKKSYLQNSNWHPNGYLAFLAVALFLALSALLSACGNTTSSGKTVAPAITQQIQATAVQVGQPATFTVAGSGTAPLTYQWTKNGTSVGTNSNTYTIAAVAQSDNNAKIQVTVSNPAGNATSGPVTLTVTTTATKPTITTQPANVTVTVGQPATFTVEASGTAPLAYQWTKNGMDVGTNSTTYT